MSDKTGLEKLPKASVKGDDLSTTQWRRLMPYFLGGLGVALMALGILINYLQSSRTATVSGKTESGGATVSAVETVRMVKVEASGAVEKPGVYDLPYDSRVKDVLIAAGGLVAKADRNYISKNINLAQRVADGTKVYFPFVGEQPVSATQPLSNLGHLGSLINVNSATADELDSLPGVGPVTAGKIISGRPYQNVSELLSKKIVSQSVYDKIKDKVSVY